MHRRLPGLLLSLTALFSVPVSAQQCNPAIQSTTPISAFTFNADQVTDNRTGLTWKRCMAGEIFSDNATPTDYTDDTCSGALLYFNWQQALQHAAADPAWRLPNSKELLSLVERACDSPAVNLQLFPGMTNKRLWSSSPNMNSSDQSWVTDFTTGTTQSNSRQNSLQVRLVTGP